eukprot:scaffold87602_cov54-Phaeocystis_antarctica.AAC.1
MAHAGPPDGPRFRPQSKLGRGRARARLAAARAMPACSSCSASPAPPPPPFDADECLQSCWRSIRRTASAGSSHDEGERTPAWPCRPCAMRPRVPATCRLVVVARAPRRESSRLNRRSWMVGARWPPLPHAVEKATTGCS